MQDSLIPGAERRDGLAIRPEAIAASSGANHSGTPPAANARDELFAFVPPPDDAAELEARAPVPGQDIHYVAINEALITGKDSVFWKAGQGARLIVPLPDGRRIEVELEHTEALGPDQFTSTGSIVGVPDGRAVFSYYHGRLSARLENLPQGDFQLRPMTDPHGQKVNQFYAVDATLIPDCGGEPEMEIGNDPGLMLVDSVNGGKTPVQPPSIGADLPEENAPLESLVSGQAIVDVLMVYTTAVRQALGAEEAVVAEIGLGLAKVNSDFANSGITARVRLAGTLEVNYDDDFIGSVASSGYQSTVLSRLQNARDGHLDAVHAKRDEVGADLVCLMVQRRDSSSAGVAYILGEPRSYIGTLYSFSVVHASLVSGAASVLSHELGHNFGCAHARNDPGASGTKDGAFTYSYAYRFTAMDTTGRSREMRTIMGYEPGTRVPYFSNPRLTLPSVTAGGSTFLFNPEPTLGVAEGAAGAADNARTIEQTAFEVASYRVSHDYSSAGKLVNISTRAHVGSDAEAMFGGFFILGNGPKRVLVRAVGPTLGGLGVPGVLADPTLRVVGTGFERTNDDWWQGDGAAEVALANRRATGLDLPNGSRDSALLLNLSPGLYSVVVQGKAGRTGQAMLEAYEFAAGQSKLVNISTRAYGSVDRPIFGGFVVEADPQQPNRRKRMLIRVSGPSLADYGIAANLLMSDPLLQLYDSRSRLILENDDWDPPTVTFNGSSTPVIVRGEVDQASERAVFDAVRAVTGGGGSMRPTEPGVVVELPPGLYSAIVRPFEKLPNQPGVPGIALLEIYELPGDGRLAAD
jgi:hypothetical protein